MHQRLWTTDWQLPTVMTLRWPAISRLGGRAAQSAPAPTGGLLLGLGGVLSADRVDRDRRRWEALWDLALAGELLPGQEREPDRPGTVPVRRWLRRSPCCATARPGPHCGLWTTCTARSYAGQIRWCSTGSACSARTCGCCSAVRPADQHGVGPGRWTWRHRRGLGVDRITDPRLHGLAPLRLWRSRLPLRTAGRCHGLHPGAAPVPDLARTVPSEHTADPRCGS